MLSLGQDGDLVRGLQPGLNPLGLVNILFAHDLLLNCVSTK